MYLLIEGQLCDMLARKRSRFSLKIWVESNFLCFRRAVEAGIFFYGYPNAIDHALGIAGEEQMILDSRSPERIDNPTTEMFHHEISFPMPMRRPHHKDIGGENASKHVPSSASRDI